jgi:hypothetical protein
LARRLLHQVRELLSIITGHSTDHLVDKVASATPSVSLDKSISVAEAALDGTYNGHPASVQYIRKEDGSLVLTRSVQIQNKPQGMWYDAFVDAHSGELVHVTDFVGKATVRATSRSRTPL